MFFFFKQKTAYEMRISDWSSDVCSSDLAAGAQLDLAVLSRGVDLDLRPFGQLARDLVERVGGRGGRAGHARVHFQRLDHADVHVGGGEAEPALVDLRSEEHTSELQSLMRISYAVFCLKNIKIYQCHKYISQN